MNLMDEFKSDAAAVDTIRGWIGEGGIPVSAEHATKRARICVDCPFNNESRWNAILKNPVATVVKALVELKNKSKLKTELDSKIFSCMACNCVLGLKIWVPMEHIRAYMPDKQLSKLPPYCWIKREAT